MVSSEPTLNSSFFSRLYGALMQMLAQSHPSNVPFAFGRFLGILILLVFYTWALVDTYDHQIAEANTGMFPLVVSHLGWGYCLVVTFWLARVLAKARGEPSDFFLIFYCSIVLISFLVLHSLAEDVDDQRLTMFLAFLIVPVVTLTIFKKFIPRLKVAGLLSSRAVQNLVVGVVCLTLLAAFSNAPASAGFGLDNSYTRRLEGRQIYASGELISYALAMCMNGFTPYLAFRAGTGRSKSLLLFSSCVALFFFWLVGAKAPFYYVAIAFLLGSLIKMGVLKYFALLVLGGVVGLYVGVLAEWRIFDGYSMIVDYFFRRVFAVQAEVLNFYFNFLTSDKPFEWDWLRGAADSSFQVTYFIGAAYVHDVDANVNTNAFLHALSGNGLVGYFSAVVSISVFLVVSDRLFRSSGNPTYIFLGFMYGLLIIEQAFTVAMISSGIGVLFVLTLLERATPGPRIADSPANEPPPGLNL